MGFDGGFAEQIVVNERYLVRIPENVTEAAVAGDSILTAYHAVKIEAEANADKTVGLVGLGGVGLNGVRVVALLSARVYGFDIERSKFDSATAQGAKVCFKSLDEAEGVKFNVIVDFAGVGTTIAQAVEKVKAGGRVVLVGMGSPTMELSTLAVVTRRIQIRGSLGEVLDLIGRGEIVPVLEEILFVEVCKGLKKAERSEVKGRLFTN